MFWDVKTLCDANGCNGWALIDESSNNIAMTAGNAFYRVDKLWLFFHYLGARAP